MANNFPSAARDWLEANMDKYDVHTLKGKMKCIRAGTRATKLAEKTIRNHLSKIMRERGIPSEVPGRGAAKPGKPTPAVAVTATAPLPDDSDLIDPADLLGRIDVVAQIKKYLDTVVKNKYIDSEKLRSKFGIGKDKWKEISTLPIFDGRTFSYTCSRTGRRTTVWSSRASITTAKETISLSRYDS